MVYVNDKLYRQSSDQQSYSELKDEFIYLGQILTDITSDQSDSTNVFRNVIIKFTKDFKEIFFSHISKPLSIK